MIAEDEPDDVDYQEPLQHDPTPLITSFWDSIGQNPSFNNNLLGQHRPKPVDYFGKMPKNWVKKRELMEARCKKKQLCLTREGWNYRYWCSNQLKTTW